MEIIFQASIDNRLVKKITLVNISNGTMTSNGITNPSNIGAEHFSAKVGVNNLGMFVKLLILW